MAAVTIEVFAGLGNQLFQFAAGYSLAQRTGSSLLVAPIPGGHQRAFGLDSFAINLHLTGRGTLQERIANRLAHHTGIVLPSLYRQTTFGFDENFLALKPPVRLSGYFQSELYFAHVAPDIRRMAVLRAGLSPEAAEIAADIEAAPLPVSIHIRRGDYATLEDSILFHVLDPAYYARATGLLSKILGSEPRYFIFSDEPERAEETLSYLSNRKIATAGLDRPEEDLILMSRCRHHIIANSTFSWWGAWLGAASDKIVIAPRQWFKPAGLRRNNISDLLPPGWIVL